MIWFLLTFVKPVVEQAQDSQGVTEVAYRRATVGTIKSTLSGSYFDKLIHIHRLE